jgi:hypothetical protein
MTLPIPGKKMKSGFGWKTNAVAEAISLKWFRFNG